MSWRDDYSVRGVLESNTMLNALPVEQLQELAPRCRLAQCAKGELIWLSGADTAFFGLVGAGFVKMVRSNLAGADMTLEIMGPGQIFGLLGQIEGSGCPLTAIGLTDMVYLKIPTHAFMPLYRSNDSIKDRLVRRTAMRLHQRHDFMVKLSTGSAEERIAAILLVLADSYGQGDGASIVINVPLTRQQIGEMAGTTTETTIRVISKWAQAGLVETDHHLITILDHPKFERKLG